MLSGRCSELTTVPYVEHASFNERPVRLSRSGRFSCAHIGAVAFGLRPFFGMLWSIAPTGCGLRVAPLDASGGAFFMSRLAALASLFTSTSSWSGR